MDKKTKKSTHDGVQYIGEEFIGEDESKNAGWSEGLMTGGVVHTETVDFDSPDTSFSYSFDDINQLDLFSEEDLRDKYPALKQAHEHYISVLEVCKTKEKEEKNED